MTKRFRQAAIGLCLAAAAALSAQQPAQEPAPAVTLRVGTELVLVDVVVKDKDGNAVADLRKEDFTVFEEGDRREIVAFSFTDAEREPSAIERPAPLPLDVHTNRPEYRAPPGQLTVLLLDEMNTPQHVQSRIREQALEYVNGKLDPRHPTAILLLREHLTVLQEFSTDPERLHAVLEAYEPQTSVMMNRMRDNLKLPSAIEHTTPEFRRMALEMKRDHIEFLLGVTDARVRDTVQALEFIARTLAGHPGRKNLVWISHFFPLSYTPDREELPDPDLRVGLSRSYMGALRRATSRLGDAQVALYTINARGLRVPDPAEYGTPLASPVTGRRNTRDFASQSQLPFESEEDARETMMDFAVQTGGQSFLNTNDFATAISDSVKDGSRYYLLGYRPAGTERSDVFRKIQVRVKRKDVSVRHRPGYFPTRAAADPDPEAGGASVVPAGDAITGVVADPSLNSTELTFLAYIGRTGFGDEGRFKIQFHVDSDRIRFARSSDGRWNLDLDFYAGGYADRLQPAAGAHQNIKAQLDAATYQKALETGIVFALELDFDPRQYRTVLVVRDNSTGRVGSLTLPQPGAADR